MCVRRLLGTHDRGLVSILTGDEKYKTGVSGE